MVCFSGRTFNVCRINVGMLGFDIPYSPKRKVIIEKYCNYERNKVIIFLKKRKTAAVLKQNFEEAQLLRFIEDLIQLDFNLAEEYVLIVNKKY